MIKIKLIIFDCYGVVLHGGYVETCAVLSKRFKRDSQEIYAVMYKKYFNQAALRQITQQQAWELALQELALPLSVIEAKNIHYGLMMVNQDMRRFLQEIDGKFKTLLLSKNTRSQFHDCDVNLGFKRFFTNIINTWEYGLPKASRETMEFVMERFKVEPNEIIYTDDQPENLEVAQKIGIKTILYQNHQQFLADFNKLIK